MGLFEKKRSVVALSDQALDTIKEELDSVLSVAKSYDQIMVKNGDGILISLEGRIRGDLLAFTLYLSGVSGNWVSPKEIQTVNRLFDIDLSHVDFEIFYADVSNKYYERSVPASILLIKELGNQIEREARRFEGGAQMDRPNFALAFACDLINVYALIGSALISADSTVTERESADLIRYLYLMNTAVQGGGAPLPSGAASRTVEAHVRLFGKAPKLR